MLLPSQLTDPQTGQAATPALPMPYPRTGQGGEPRLNLPDAITGKPGDPRYPYREPPPAPPPGGPPPGPPLPGAEQTGPTPPRCMAIRSATRFRTGDAMTAARVARIALSAALVALLIGGLLVAVTSSPINKTRITAYFENSNGIYPGDDVRIPGRPGRRDRNDRAAAATSQDHLLGGRKIPDSRRRQGGCHLPNRGVGTVHSAHPGVHDGPRAWRRRDHSPGTHRGAGGVGRSARSTGQAEPHAGAHPARRGVHVQVHSSPRPPTIFAGRARPSATR